MFTTNGIQLSEGDLVVNKYRHFVLSQKFEHINSFGFIKEFNTKYTEITVIVQMFDIDDNNINTMETSLKTFLNYYMPINELP